MLFVGLKTPENRFQWPEPHWGRLHRSPIPYSWLGGELAVPYPITPPPPRPFGHGTLALCASSLVTMVIRSYNHACDYLPPPLSFQDSWWTMSVSSLVILAASVFEISCGKQPEKQTNAAETLTMRLPSAWVTSL